MSRYRGLIVLTLDILTIFCCNFLMFLPYLMQGNIRLFNLVMHIGMLTVCVLVFQLMFRTYNTLWRYAESREYLTLLAGMGLGGLLYAVLNWALEASGIWNSQALTGTTLAILVCWATASSTGSTAAGSPAWAAACRATPPPMPVTRRR